MSCDLKLIYNYTITKININEDIKDVMQDVMLAIWQGISRYTGEASFRTWCIGIAKRKISDYYRKAYKQCNIPITEVEDYLTEENNLEKIDNSITVNSAINKLNGMEKELVSLIFTTQLSYTEISDLLLIPVGTVKSRMSTIKQKLKKQLEMEGN